MGKIDLKHVLVDQNLREIRDQGQIPPEQTTKLLKSLEGKSEIDKQEAIYKASPFLTIGIAIKNLLSRVQPADQKESAEIWVWIVRVENALKTTKGILEVDGVDDLNKLIGFLGKIKPEQLNPIINGQVHDFLTKESAKITLGQA